jgi:hypothetical protein
LFADRSLFQGEWAMLVDAHTTAINVGFTPQVNDLIMAILPHCMPPFDPNYVEEPYEYPPTHSYGEMAITAEVQSLQVLLATDSFTSMIPMFRVDIETIKFNQYAFGHNQQVRSFTISISPRPSTIDRCAVVADG